MLTKAWVDRVMEAGLDAPDVVGPDRTPEDDKRDAWALRYVATFVECGVPLKLALETYRAGMEQDFDSDPEQAAHDEMSYWDDDGDGAE